MYGAGDAGIEGMDRAQDFERLFRVVHHMIVLQCGFILASALLFWGFRSGENEGGYGYISW